MRTYPLFAALALLPAAHAQSVPPASREGPLELKPFVVQTEKDTGYQATDTIAGGRLSTNLLATPTDVTMITREFIDDLAPLSMIDAQQWLTGAGQFFSTDLASAVDFGGGLNSFRGFASGINTRNYFRYDATPDAYVIERLEGARGANSILYGDAPAGGQVNNLTKRARFSNRTTLTARVDGEATRAVYTDTDRALTDKLGVRLNTQAQQRRTWIRNFRDDRYGAALAATFRPQRSTEIRLDSEYTYARQIGENRFTDNVSLWDGTTTVKTPLVANPAAATGVSRFTTDKLVYLPELGHVYNFRDFGQTSGSGLQLVEGAARPAGSRFPRLSRREFQIAPPDAFNHVKTYTAALFVEHTTDSGLSLETAGGYAAVLRDRVDFGVTTNARIDINEVLPRLPGEAATAPLRANPNYGKFYSEGRWTNTLSDQTTKFVRAAAAYPLKTAALEQIFSVVASYRMGLFDPETFNYGRSNGTDLRRNQAANNLVTWRYWDHAGAKQPWVTNGQTLDGQKFETFYARDTETPAKLKSVQFNTVGYYFHRTLTLVGGYRWDDYDRRGTNLDTTDAFGLPATYATTILKGQARTLSLGLTYFPVPVVGVYANRGGGLMPNTAGGEWIGARGAVEFSNAKTLSGGLRFRLFSGKIIASAGYYDTTDANRQTTVSRTEINNLWTAMNRTDLLIPGTATTFLDTLDFSGSGYEAEVTANLTKRFRGMINFSLPKTGQVNARPDTRAYIARNLAAWQAALTDPSLSPAQQTVVRNTLPAVQDLVTASAEGRSLDGTYRYRLNLFGTYTFTEGSLRGLSMGGGANIFGRQQIGNQPNAAFAYVYDQEYFTVTGTASYRTKLAGKPVTFQVNVSNLLDYREPIFKSTTVYQGVSYRNAFNYLEPRNVSLTVKFDL